MDGPGDESAGSMVRWIVIVLLATVLIGLLAAKLFPPESQHALVRGIYPWASPSAGWIRYESTHAISLYGGGVVRTYYGP